MSTRTLAVANTVYNLATLLSQANAPTVALAGGGAGNVDNGAHKYLVTFVSASGETVAGVPSAAVTVVDKTADGKVAISAIPLGPTGTTARKIYRTAAAGSTYLFHSTISNNTATTATDNTADASLGTAVPLTVDTSGLNLCPMAFEQVMLLSDDANAGSIYISESSLLTSTNYDIILAHGESVDFGLGTVFSGSLYVTSGTAAQVLHIYGRAL